MGSYTFRWPHNANEVYVTGTFDDWGKTIKLNREGDVFEKDVQLSATDEKLHYKFVVDGIWTTDTNAPEEEDGSNNINNVLHPDQIQPKDTHSSLQNGNSVMAGVTPDSTTAALAGGVPKESSKNTFGDAALSSAAPGSTTAELAKNVPFEQRANVPGQFPATPGADQFSVNPIPASNGTGNPINLKPGEKVPDSSTFNPNTVQSTARTDKEGYDQFASNPYEADSFAVNPVPASSGTGNPIHLKPGEKVPDSSTFNSNTIQSTARTDKEGYEKDASHSLTSGQAKESNAFGLPPVSGNMIPESSLPMGDANQGASDPVTIQSAGPTATTAGLAGAVPLESQKADSGKGVYANDVPEVVKNSISEADRSPEAAANKEAVGEKKELEHELQDKIPVEESSGTPAPTATATASETAPKATGQPVSAPLSPRSTSPTSQPMVTTGASAGQAPEVSNPDTSSATVPPASKGGATGDGVTKANEGTAAENKAAGNGKEPTSPAKDTADKNGAKTEKKKRNRASGFFQKLKEKLK